MTDPVQTDEWTIRIHDEAISQWLDGYTVTYPGFIDGTPITRPILRTMAPQHRAYATLPTVVATAGLVPGDNPDDVLANAREYVKSTPLPLVSIERDDPIFSNEINLGGVSFYTRVLPDGTVLNFNAPGHYLTQYRLTLWTDREFTRAHWIQWLLAQLGKRGGRQSEMFLTIYHPSIGQSMIHSWQYLGSANLGGIETDGPRLIQQMASFTLRSWAFKPADVNLSGTIAGDLLFDVVDYTTGEVYDTIGGGNLFVPQDQYYVTGGANCANTDSGVSVDTDNPGQAILAVGFSYPDTSNRTIWQLSASASVNGSPTIGVGVLNVGLATPTNDGTGTFNKTAHGLVNNDQIYIQTPVTGLALGTAYFIVGATTNAFKISATLGGSAIVYPVTGQSSIQYQRLNVVGPSISLATGVVSRFYVLNSPAGTRTAGFVAASDDTPTTSALSDIVFRQIAVGNKVVPTGISPISGGMTYSWTGVPAGAYLAVVVTSSGTSVVTVGTATLPIDSSIQGGTAWPVQVEEAGTASLSVIGGSVSGVWLQPFDGRWPGATL